MKIKQSALAAAVTAALAMGVVGQAAASVYGGSLLEIQSSVVNITGAGLGTKITSFTFDGTNTSTLNGVNGATGSATCGGLPGAPDGGVSTNDCGPVNARLDPVPSNAPGGAPVRANNDFTLFGPALNQYSNSDSVIYTSQLTLDPGPSLGGNATHTKQIAESELQGGANAKANAELKSTTGFTFKFNLVGGGGLTLDFEADPFLRAAIINDPTFANGNAQAAVQATFSLTQDSTGDAITWDPQGTATNNCDVDAGLVGVVCNETNDNEDLNRTLSVSSNGSDVDYGAVGGFSLFGINITGLTDGDWTFSLQTVTSTTTRRVPEPGVLALMGIGLLGLVTSARRKNRF